LRSKVRHGVRRFSVRLGRIRHSGRSLWNSYRRSSENLPYWAPVHIWSR